MDDWDIGFGIRVFGKSASESELLGFLLPNKGCWDVGIQTRVVVIFGVWFRFDMSYSPNQSCWDTGFQVRDLRILLPSVQRLIGCCLQNKVW